MTFARSALLGALVLVGVSSSATRAEAQNSCLIDFKNTFALSNIYDKARTHFGIETRANPSTGALEACTPFANDDWQNCWLYRQRCNLSTYYVNVWSWASNNHFHMFFDNPLLQDPLCSCNPGDGYGPGFGFKPSGGSCITSACPNWGQEPRRSIYPHTKDDWVYVWMEQGGDGQQHVFTMYDIIIGGTQPAELWYVKTDGTTWGWTSLSPGYHVLNATDATSVWINATGNPGSGGPVEVVDYIIVPQY